MKYACQNFNIKITIIKFDFFDENGLVGAHIKRIRCLLTSALMKNMFKPAYMLCYSSVATLVLILIKSPYKDQNGKNGPYLVLIFTFGPYFQTICLRTVNLIRVAYACHI